MTIETVQRIEPARLEEAGEATATALDVLFPRLYANAA